MYVKQVAARCGETDRRGRVETHDEAGSHTASRPLRRISIGIGPRP
jgi:hypothetical protein